MPNRGHHHHGSLSFVPVMVPRVIPLIRSLIPTTTMALSVDLNPSVFLIDGFPSKSRNCFLFLRKSVCPESALRFLWTRHTGCCPLRDLSGGWWFLSLLDRILSHKPPWISLDILPRKQSHWYGKTIRLWLILFVFMALQPLHLCFAHTKEIQEQFDCDYIDCVVELWMHQSGFSGIVMLRLHVGLAYFWRQDLLGIAQICWLRKASAMYRWELIDTREPETRIGTVVHDLPVAFGVKTFTNVYGVKCTIGRAYPGATSLFYVMWSFNARMSERHTYHIRVRWILKEEYIMFYNMIASKALSKRSIVNFTFSICPLQHMVHKAAYVKVCFCEILYGLNTVVIFII